jgi:hypothetical protein
MKTLNLKISYPGSMNNVKLWKFTIFHTPGVCKTKIKTKEIIYIQNKTYNE